MIEGLKKKKSGIRGDDQGADDDSLFKVIFI